MGLGWFKEKNTTKLMVRRKILSFEIFITLVVVFFALCGLAIEYSIIKDSKRQLIAVFLLLLTETRYNVK